MNNVIKYRTKLSFIADGENREFNFNFQIFGKENINVYLDDILQTEGFSVILDEVGGTVIFEQAPEKEIQITLIRNLPVRRTTDFQEGGPFRASRVNGEFDYQVACFEQIEEKLSRVIYKPPYLMDDSNLSLPEPIPGRTLIWTDDNSGLKNSKYDVDNLENQLSDAVKDVDSKWQNVLEKSNKIDDIAKHIIPNSHTLGEIFTDGFVGLLEGQGWCQGDVLPSSVYSGLVAEFDKYLVDSTKGIAWIDFATYESRLVEDKGNCILFGYDAVNGLIRLPTIQDGVGIFQANTIAENGKFYNDQLQGHKHQYLQGQGAGNGSNTKISSESNNTNPTGVGSSFNGVYLEDLGNGTPRIGSETRNKQILRRYKVQLANVGISASENQYANFVDGLTNKADKDFGNTDLIDYIIDYYPKTAEDLANYNGVQWEIWKSGKARASGLAGKTTIYLPFTYRDTSYKVEITETKTDGWGGTSNPVGADYQNKNSFRIASSSASVRHSWETIGILEGY